MKKSYFENLDSLRFLAFFAVFLTHTIHPTQIQTFFADNVFLREIALYISDGKEGVSFFFVLSGFLITYLILLEKEQTGKLNLKNFYVRRILRIFPLYYAVLLIGFVVYPFIKSQIGIDTFQPHDWRYHIVFLSNIDLINLYQNTAIDTDILMLVINWSLSVEEQFYIVYPLLVLLLSRQYYTLLFSLVIISSLTFRYFHLDTPGLVLDYHTFAVMSDLAVGACIAYCTIYLKLDYIFSKISKPLIVSIYILGFCWVIFGNIIVPFKEYAIFERFIHTIFYGFIILEQNYSKNSIYKLGKLNLLKTWGKYTYGLYLLHPIGMQIWIVLLVKIFGWDITDLGVQQFIFMILSFISTLILAYVSYNLFEKPFLKLKKRFIVVK